MGDTPLKNDLLLRVALGQPVERPPVWAMRQAGRYLAEYRAVRKKAGSFKEMIAHPEWAAEVTLQPIDLIGVDAAIIFSDILVIPEAMGVDYQMVAGTGPVFPKPVRSPHDLKEIRPVSQAENLEDTYEAIRITKRALHNRVPLIGFAGAPWTIFCYMTEGSGSKTFSQAKRILFQNPQFATTLLENITEATVTYLKGQIAAGVDVIQLFDSWGGILSPKAFQMFSLPYLKKICREITEVPIITYAKGAFFALSDMDQLACEVIGLDWQTDPQFAGEFIQQKALQGNLDPSTLFASPQEIEKETLNMLNRFPKGRHIANLGHGMYPDIPPDSLKAFVHTVQNFSY